MKKYALTTKGTSVAALLGVALLYAGQAICQVKIGNNPTTINPSALLELESSTKGFLPPRMTRLNMYFIQNPVAGLTVYCTDCATPSLCNFDGTNWINLANGTELEPICPVYSASGQRDLVFMCHNLGADKSLDPNPDVITEGLHGDYYQWGRNAPAGTTSGIIGTWDSQGGDRNNANWTATAKGPNDPCPAGFRVPSKDEWQMVIDNNGTNIIGSWFTTTNYDAARYFGGTPGDPQQWLTLPASGIRIYTDGTLEDVGQDGWATSSSFETANTGLAYALYVGELGWGVSMANVHNALPVRCIAL